MCVTLVPLRVRWIPFIALDPLSREADSRLIDAPLQIVECCHHGTAEISPLYYGPQCLENVEAVFRQLHEILIADHGLVWGLLRVRK